MDVDLRLIQDCSLPSIKTCSRRLSPLAEWIMTVSRSVSFNYLLRCICSASRPCASFEPLLSKCICICYVMILLFYHILKPLSVSFFCYHHFQSASDLVHLFILTIWLNKIMTWIIWGRGFNSSPSIQTVRTFSRVKFLFHWLSY